MEGRPTSPPVVPVEAAPMLRFSALVCNLSFGPTGHFVRFYPVIYRDIVSVHHIITIRAI
jgi:hypothetical protein